MREEPADSVWEAEVATVRLVVGAGARRRVPEEVAALGGTRVLLVTDEGVGAAGHAVELVDLLGGAGLEVAVWDDVSPNPTTTEIEAGAVVAREWGADLLVALGGGSVLDVTKGINFVATNGGPMARFWGFGHAIAPMLPTIALPTTGGTGSDAQSYALVSDPGTGRKMACGDRKARFRTVVLDPDLAVTVPAVTAAQAGLDALSHVVESYVSTRRTPVSALFGREAWRLLDRSVDRALSGAVSPDVWLDMLLGAHLAGAAIEGSMLGAAHAAANPLTACFGVPHGAAVALTLPAVVRFNRDVVGSLYAELCAGGAEALASRVESLRRSAGLPDGLELAGVDPASIPELARLATAEWTGRFNPRPVGAEAFEEVYRGLA